MSAYLVNDKHIKAMLQFAVHSHCISWRGNFYYYHQGLKHDISTDEDIQRAGQILVDENYRSLTERYGDPYEPHTFTNPHMLHDKTPVEILKACACYTYQSCETGEAYYKSEAYSIVKDIRDYAIGQLPGYDEAQWEITR